MLSHCDDITTAICAADMESSIGKYIKSELALITGDFAVVELQRLPDMDCARNHIVVPVSEAVVEVDIEELVVSWQRLRFLDSAEPSALQLPKSITQPTLSNPTS